MTSMRGASTRPSSASSAMFAAPTMPAFPLCSIYTTYNDVTLPLTFYASPPHLASSSPLFTHLLNTFLRSIHALHSVSAAALEGAEGVVYPPTAFIALPSMMQGHTFHILSQDDLSASSTNTSSNTDQSKRSHKRVSFSPSQDRAKHTPSQYGDFLTVNERPPAQSMQQRRSSRPGHQHSASVATHFVPSAELHQSPSVYAMQSQSPSSPLPLPLSLSAPSSFPLPSYSATIPQLRQILGSAFLPLPLQTLPALFASYNVTTPAGNTGVKQSLLPRSTWQPLLANCLTTHTRANAQSLTILDNFLSHFFSFLDLDSDDLIDYTAFSGGLALLLPLLPSSSSLSVSDELDQLSIAFQLIDRERTGYITPLTLYRCALSFVPILLNLTFPLSLSHANHKRNHATSDNYHGGLTFDLPSLQASIYEIAGKIVREAFGCGDVNVDGLMDYEEFRSLHLRRPSVLPFINVLVDPDRQHHRSQQLYHGRATSPITASVSRAEKVENRCNSNSVRSRHSGGNSHARHLHHRSTSMPAFVNEERKSVSPAWERGIEQAKQRRKQHLQQQQQQHSVDDNDDDDDDDDDDSEDGDEDDSEDTSTTPAVDLSNDVASALAATQAIESSLAALTLSTSNASGSNSRPRRALWKNSVSVRDADSMAHRLDEDEDAEQTEEFLERMYGDLMTMKQQEIEDERQRLKQATNTDTYNEEDGNDNGLDDELDNENDEDDPEEFFALTSTPRLSSLSSPSSFLAIYPHIHPFTNISLEDVLELFQLLTGDRERLSIDGLERLIVVLGMGRSEAIQQIMAATLKQLYYWFDHGNDTNNDDGSDIASLDLVLSMSCICASDVKEQLSVAFALCDRDADSRLTFEELTMYLQTMLGAFFSLTDEWNTLARLTAQEQKEKEERRRKRLEKRAERECTTSLLRQSQSPTAHNVAESKSVAGAAGDVVGNETTAAPAAAAVVVEEEDPATSNDPELKLIAQHTEAESKSSEHSAAATEQKGSTNNDTETDQQLQRRTPSPSPSLSRRAANTPNSLIVPLSPSPSQRPRSASPLSPMSPTPSFSLASLRHEVDVLLRTSAVAAAEHCFSLHTQRPVTPDATIEMGAIYQWMAGLVREVAQRQGKIIGIRGDDTFPMFDVARALFALL